MRVVSIVLSVLIVGCAANQEQLSQTSVPPVQGPFQTDALQGAEGPDNVANFVSGPHNRRNQYNDQGITDETDGFDDGKLVKFEFKEGKMYLPIGSDYSIHNNSVTQSNTSTNSGEVTQSPSGTQTASGTTSGGAMNQNQEPRSQVQGQLPIAPGGVAQTGGQTGALSEGGAATSGDAPTTNTATVQKMIEDAVRKALAEQADGAESEDQGQGGDAGTDSAGDQ